jgi:hypothetical protein
MTNIFIDIPIFLKYRSQVMKDVFLVYHLNIESNIPSSCVVALNRKKMKPTEPKNRDKTKVKKKGENEGQ